MDKKYKKTAKGSLHYKIMWNGPALFGPTGAVRSNNPNNN